MSKTLYESCGVDLLVLKKLVSSLESSLDEAQQKSQKFETLNAEQKAEFLVSIALAAGLVVGLKEESDIILKGLSLVFKSGPAVSVKDKVDALESLTGSLFGSKKPAIN